MNFQKMSLILASMSFSVLSLGGNVTAQTETQPASPINLEAITCRDLLQMDGEEEENTIIFMHGYLTGKRGEMMIDAGKLSAATDAVRNTCIDEPDRALMGVFEEHR